MNIINENVIDSFLVCPYKAYQKLNNKIGVKSEFEDLENDLLAIYKKKYYKEIYAEYGIDKILYRIEINQLNLNDSAFIFEPFFLLAQFSISFDALEIKKIAPHKFVYIPITILPRRKISQKHKVAICCKASIINKHGTITIENGKVINGVDLKVVKVSLNRYKTEVNKVLREVNELVVHKKIPNTIQINHCNICEFQIECKKLLQKNDDLSLLGGISKKFIHEKKQNGIFTINQLSYTFRPRKNNKLINAKKRHYPELRALALRTNRIHFWEIPKIPENKPEMYLDIECLPDESFYYLIGIIISEGEKEEVFSFWADTYDNEKEIFKKFFELVSQYNDFTLYHFGNFDLKALSIGNIRLNRYFDKELKLIYEKAVNVLTFFSLDIYLPIYSNSLKNIANFLGFNWTENKASGIKSIVWRKRWELSEDELYKNKLILYNLDDCKALKNIKGWILTCAETIDENEENELVDVDSYNWQDPEDYFNDEFKSLNKFAYFNYQQTKIFLKTNPKTKTAIQRTQKGQKAKKQRINQTIDINPQTCYRCSSRDIKQLIHLKSIITDIKFITNGIKKWIVEYHSGLFYCNNCKKRFIPKEFNVFKKYGDNLLRWAIHKYFKYNMSYGNIVDFLKEININITHFCLIRNRTLIVEQYLDTYNEIKTNLLEGPILHIDETSVKLKGQIKGYVWVFASMDSVVYLFRKTRKADFLKELLNDYDGVLISDFYTGYNSLSCNQQKCLIHLIRDLNQDLYKNQLNIEFKMMIENFGKLLKKIIETVNKYGLKKRHLNKHKKDVDRYYKMFILKEYETELAAKYQKRFIKYKDKLFTFLNYDNVPWNNNNAEYAIKSFAALRERINNRVTERTINECMVILSIQETCKYRGLNFLDFWMSGMKHFEEYCVTH